MRWRWLKRSLPSFSRTILKRQDDHRMRFLPTHCLKKAWQPLILANVATVFAVSVLLACDSSASGPAAPKSAGASSKLEVPPEWPMFNGVKLHTGPHLIPQGMKGLTIRGFNYTDLYIGNFAVNGAGGGNIEVSDHHMGGGKGTCCAPLPGGIELPMTVEISWKRDGDVPYCKQRVLLEGPVPNDPYAFDVHFYQDGTIQVAISQFRASARVELDRFSSVQRKATGNVNNDTKFSRCGI
jgi:hypothetical protein